MLRKEETALPVPEQTACIAQAAFPQGNVYLWIRDEFGQIYRDEDFADLYSGDNRDGVLGDWQWSAGCNFSKT